MKETPQQKLRFLCVGEMWHGSDARAAFHALERLGHDVDIVDESHYFPAFWRGRLSRVVRRALRSMFIHELKSACLKQLSQKRPNCLFVFKGNHLHPDVLKFCRSQNILSANYYPDVSFMSHGALIPRALKIYDHVFNTKTYGVDDMKRELQIASISFLPPGFNPELHRPLLLSASEEVAFGSDVAFIGTWSPKKESILQACVTAAPDVNIRIWGPQWERSRSPVLRKAIVGHELTGEDYVKAICGTKVCLGLLSEIGAGSSSGDRITARTFQIPACKQVMLHERNDEVLSYFTENEEALYFDSTAELVQNISRILQDERTRTRIAEAGYQRSWAAGYSIDDRMRAVVAFVERNTS